ncbi:hypothetical protein PAEPH01_0126 [Pancytospora epiphaga]|nr:hypothetical protein PAEPH01_0126 [Pancytospora epiphaga]
MTEVLSTDLSRKGLCEIPMAKIKTDTEWLILSDNKLKKISREIRHLQNLSRLALNDNQIDEIEPEISACTGITWIDLTRNRLKALPETMGELTRISGLGLSENEFETIPECVYKFKNLRKFGFFSNKIASISPSIRNLRNLVKVDLSNNRLESLPDEFCLLVNISWLNLSNNRLKSLPLGITRLTKLEELGLGTNNLTELPDISTLSRLRILPVFKNKIKTVHPSICRLKSIEKLDFSDNQITEFPSEAIYNPTLKYLNLRNNQISKISPFIFNGCISSITMIDVSENKLKYLPYKLFKTFREITTVRLGLNAYECMAPVIPSQQSLMQICFTRILHKNYAVDPWINNIFKRQNVCDYCKASFVTDPYFFYAISYLDNDYQFVVEKMLCSSRCMRMTDK